MSVYASRLMVAIALMAFCTTGCGDAGDADRAPLPNAQAENLPTRQYDGFGGAICNAGRSGAVADRQRKQLTLLVAAVEATPESTVGTTYAPAEAGGVAHERLTVYELADRQAEDLAISEQNAESPEAAACFARLRSRLSAALDE